MCGGDKCPGFAMKGICRSSDRRNPGKARADGGGGREVGPRPCRGPPASMQDQPGLLAGSRRYHD